MADSSTKPENYSRRDALRAVGKYSLALGGASVVALSAEEAAAQAACSRPNPPWWCNGGGHGGGHGGGQGGGRGNRQKEPSKSPFEYKTF